MIQQDIFKALAPLVENRCFYGFIPDTKKKFPVIVYQFINISPNSALVDGDLDDFMVQIDIYSQTMSLIQDYTAEQSITKLLMENNNGNTNNPLPRD